MEHKIILIRKAALVVTLGARIVAAQTQHVEFDAGVAAPLGFFARQIAAAGVRERGGGRDRGVRVQVQGLPTVDAIRAQQMLDSAFGPRVPVDSAPRILSYTLIFQLVTADSTVVEFREHSFTRCANGLGTSHSNDVTQTFRREPQGWQPPAQIDQQDFATSMPCNAPRPPV